MLPPVLVAAGGHFALPGTGVGAIPPWCSRRQQPTLMASPPHFRAMGVGALDRLVPCQGTGCGWLPLGYNAR
jgi:hypothetical protein